MNNYQRAHPIQLLYHVRASEAVGKQGLKFVGAVGCQAILQNVKKVKLLHGKFSQLQEQFMDPCFCPSCNPSM